MQKYKKTAKQQTLFTKITKKTLIICIIHSIFIFLHQENVKKMKFIYILKSFAAKGGEERVMADKMNYLASHGHEILMVTFEQGEHELAYPLHPSIIHKDIDTRFFTVTNESLYKKIRLLINLRQQFIQRMTGIINQEKPDLLISTVYPLKNIRLLSKLKRTTGIPFLLESHIAYKAVVRQSDFKEKSLKYYIAKIYDEWNLRAIQHCDALIALTEGDAKNWKRYSDKVEVIPNPVTNIPEQTDIIEKEPYRIIAVGRLHSQKGFDLLIEAFSLIATRIPNWHIDIYGHGVDEKLLKTLIHTKKMEGRIILKGLTDKIFDEYRRSQFFVLSSRYEGFGLVLAEAMACGIPCVSFRCEYGPEDIIDNGTDGLLVADGNVKELADKILWMALHDNERHNMGAKAQENVKRYNIENIMISWNSLFCRITTYSSFP